MTSLALQLLATVAVASADTRTFWKVDPGRTGHPAQTSVAAERVGEGRSIVVYLERGYHFSTAGESDEGAQIQSAIAAFDDVIYPRQVALFGPCPDVDGNGKVILLVTAMANTDGHFFRFDELSEVESLARGFHSNQAEVLFLTFRQQGNRAAMNLAVLAQVFHEMLHVARDPAETSWAELVGGHAAYSCGLAPARLLWGDSDPHLAAPSPSDPWSPRGWPLLFVEYLAERLGERGLTALVTSPEPGPAAAAMVPASDRRLAAFEAFADFAVACWLDDSHLGDGRFAFSGVTPPRPLPLARLSASRPTSGQALVGAGGVAYLLVEADHERSLTLTLRGDVGARWIGRAVTLRRDGPDQQLPLAFEAGGIARVDLGPLHAGDALLVAAIAVPADDHGLDHRRLVLQWGLGWVPQMAGDRARDAYAELLRQALPNGGAAARARLATTVARLAGGTDGGGGGALATRYAWSPGTAGVVRCLEGEATQRGLSSRLTSFLRVAPGNLRQEWQNVLIDLPGRDPRRWPVVVAAHWDGARSRLDDSYLRALNVNDNASGVAVALEAAAALSRTPHRAPVLVALLAGGYHQSAGAEALLAGLQGKAAAWIELDRVGIPDSWPRHLAVTVSLAPRSALLGSQVAGALREAGLSPRVVESTGAEHTGVALASAQGIPALSIRLGDGSGDVDVPPAAEQTQLSPELMVLLAKSSATAIARVAGAP